MTTRNHHRSRRLTTCQLVVSLTCAAGLALSMPNAAAAGGRPTTTSVQATVTSTASVMTFAYERRTSPARTVVRDGAGRLVATLTDGARTVSLAGPSRTFAESTTSATVRSTTWVRLQPVPFTGTVDEVWLRSALADTTPDLLANAFRFTTGAAQDASYGPLVEGVRQEGSDWNDYLGVTAVYDGVEDRPEADQRGALDCSGYVRMVFGHLAGLPMVLQPDGVRLPRRAVQMAGSAPGTLVVPDKGTQVTDFQALLPGDLVLFDASTDDGAAVDHVGIYLGRDSTGGHRFVSSRKSVDGPTMGDVRGASRLDGSGMYANAFRAIRRL